MLKFCKVHHFADETNLIHFSKSVYRFLGIKIDENLNRKEHIHDITIKLNRANALLSIIRNYVNKHILRTTYFAIFDFHTNYANLIIILQK